MSFTDVQPPGSDQRLWSDAEVTVIVAGVRCGTRNISAAMKRMRAAFPASMFVLSTSKSEMREGHDLSGFDRVVIQDDPGLILSDKFHGGATDINQVKAYVSLALADSRTALAIVLRPGSFLFSQKALHLWAAWRKSSVSRASAGQRLLVSKFFTINPVYDERLPFQISSTFQLGTTEDLLRFWSGPEYNLRIAAWYETRPHAKASLARERQFRARFTPDQWLSLNYLYKDKAFPISYHNDVSTDIVNAFYVKMADHFIIAHPDDIDLVDADNAELLWNTYLNAICLSYREWEALTSDRPATSVSFSTKAFWPLTSRQKRLLIAARTKIDRKLFAFAGLPEKLQRQIYD